MSGASISKACRISNNCLASLRSRLLWAGCVKLWQDALFAMGTTFVAAPKLLIANLPCGGL